ncbi:MAG TPA: hypothetical protein VH143_13030 [Kofleriaceae bacterium]|nr:hypothetical protein [Kofleriaceae bacterium]
MRFALLGLLVGCTGLIGGSSSQPGDDDSSSPPPDAAPSPGETAVERAMQWVVAEVPYCQSANHQPDGDSSCSPTCERPDNPAWDAYRSDCSGFVSWAWGLPPPGHTTATLAPFDTSVSAAIDVAQLQPGDAINNDTHTMLFVDWTSSDMTAAQFMEEPGCSASQPYAREVTVTLTSAGQTITLDGYGTFTAIRQQ